MAVISGRFYLSVCLIIKDLAGYITDDKCAPYYLDSTDRKLMLCFCESVTRTYVTGFVKADPNRTRTEIHFIAEH